MARRKLFIDNNHLSSLRKLIEFNYGSSLVNSTDCIKISILIQKGKHGYISPHTLRRVFGFVKSDFCPSIHTLNILSRFCGFEDWAHFNKNESGSVTQLQDIAAICTAFFEITIPPIKKDDLNEPYYYAVRNIAKIIYDDPNLYNKVIKVLASNPTAHEYFFERFPPIDKLCSGFTIGYKFYMQHKKNPEALLFGNALLFFGAFLEEDFLMAKQYLSAMNKIKNWREYNLHPYVLARLIGSNLALSYVNNDADTRQRWLSILEQALNNNPNKYGHKINSFEFEIMICEYLLLVQDYDYVKVIMADVVKNIRHDPQENMADLYYISSHLSYYKSLMMTGDYKKAAKLYFINEIGNDQTNTGYYIFIKNYYTLHLLQCRLKLTNRQVAKKELLKQYYHLINVTRFTYFNKLMQ